MPATVQSPPHPPQKQPPPLMPGEQEFSVDEIQPDEREFSPSDVAPDKPYLSRLASRVVAENSPAKYLQDLKDVALGFGASAVQMGTGAYDLLRKGVNPLQLSPSGPSGAEPGVAPRAGQLPPVPPIVRQAETGPQTPAGKVGTFVGETAPYVLGLGEAEAAPSFIAGAKRVLGTATKTGAIRTVQTG